MTAILQRFRAIERNASRSDGRDWNGGCRRSLAVAILGALALLAGCSDMQQESSSTRPEPVQQSTRATSGRVAEPLPQSGPVLPTERTTASHVQRGKGVLASGGTSAAPSSGAPGDITLNFVNANVRDVIDAVMGQILHLNYTVDPKVQGTVTVQTSSPITRDAVLPTLEGVLQSNGVALVKSGAMYQVVPLKEASRSAPPVAGLGGGGAVGAAGYGVQIIPLQYASARQLQHVLQPFVPTGGVLQVDDTRNVLIVSGTQGDISSFIHLARVFDVDWLKGMSFGLIPLQQGSAASVAQELNSILSAGADNPLAGVLRIVPIERINAILLVSPQPAYIQQGKEWIERLDEGADESAPRLYVYYVQNSRAADLAKVLSGMLGGGVRTIEPAVAPGASMTSLASPAAASGLTTAMGAPSAGGPALPAPAGAAAGVPAPGGTGSAPPPAAPAESGGGDQGGAAPSLVPPPSFGAQRAAAAGNDLAQSRVVADEKNNALLIYARPPEYRMIEAALKKLDILPQQVLIEATVAEVTLNHDLQYGLQWFFKSGHSSLTFSPFGAAVAPVFPGFDYMLSGGSAQVILNALSAITDVKVVSAPQLMVLDHQTARLQVGDEVPIAVQQAQSTVTSGAPVINTIQYYNTGVILNVTPRVNTTGVATLEIEQEVSAVTKTTSSNIDSPTIQQRRFRSVVAVGDGQTIALGGLISDTDTKSKSGLPFLSDIPILGSLASTTDRNHKRTELLILLTPRVVRNSEEAQAVTDELQRRLHAVMPSPSGKI
jgi:general secretion pathway protein D